MNMFVWSGNVGDSGYVVGDVSYCGLYVND